VTRTEVPALSRNARALRAEAVELLGLQHAADVETAAARPPHPGVAAGRGESEDGVIRTLLIRALPFRTTEFRATPPAAQSRSMFRTS